MQLPGLESGRLSGTALVLRAVLWPLWFLVGRPEPGGQDHPPRRATECGEDWRQRCAAEMARFCHKEQQLAPAPRAPS